MADNIGKHDKAGAKPKKRKRRKSKARRIAQYIIILCLAGIVAVSGWKLYDI
jgi:hypothetical protein